MICTLLPGCRNASPAPVVLLCVRKSLSLGIPKCLKGNCWSPHNEAFEIRLRFVLSECSHCTSFTLPVRSVGEGRGSLDKCFLPAPVVQLVNELPRNEKILPLPI